MPEEPNQPDVPNQPDGASNQRPANKNLLILGGFSIVLLIALGIYFLVLPALQKEEPQKVYKVGILSGLDFFAATTDSFKAAMTELGYIEGKNITYDFQKTNFEPEKEKQILAKFVADKVDLIVTFPTEVSLAAKEAIKGTNIPLIFDTAFIEGVDLINSVREPGNNITGVRYPGPDLAVKRLETMVEIVPSAKRIMVPYQKGYPIVPPELEALRPAAQKLGVTLVEVPGSNAEDLKAYFDGLPKGDIGFDAILMISEPLAVTPDPFLLLVKFASDHKLPMAGAYIALGGYETIFGIDISVESVGKQAAPLADKIFKGTPAGTIAVVTAETYLTVSPKAAQTLGITLPEALLSRANQIIK
ncbi:MAG TPA: ABC transporter substrate-binding protein [Candidatus Nanoarchaeia archaeon]